jgi:hypothetical protein
VRERALARGRVGGKKGVREGTGEEQGGGG